MTVSMNDPTWSRLDSVHSIKSVASVVGPSTMKRPTPDWAVIFRSWPVGTAVNSVCPFNTRRTRAVPVEGAEPQFRLGFISRVRGFRTPFLNSNSIIASSYIGHPHRIPTPVVPLAPIYLITNLLLYAGCNRHTHISTRVHARIWCIGVVRRCVARRKYNQQSCIEHSCNSYSISIVMLLRAELDDTELVVFVVGPDATRTSVAATRVAAICTEIAY